MADVLTQYLHHTRNEGKVPSESGFEKFKAGSQEERTTHPLAHHPKYVNLDGTPYTLGGETLQRGLAEGAEFRDEHRNDRCRHSGI